MNTMPIAGTGLTSSRLAYGCMKIGGGWYKEVLTAEKRSAGFTFCDHADIHCAGNSEIVFGEYLRAHRNLPSSTSAIQAPPAGSAPPSSQSADGS